MDYSTMDLEYLIDTLGTRDLELTYPRFIHTSPSQTKDSVRLDDEPTKFPPLSITNMLGVPSSSSLPPFNATFKRRKVNSTSTPQI